MLNHLAGRAFFRGLAGNDTIDGGANGADGDWASYGNTSNKGGSQGIVINFLTAVFIA